MYIETDAALAGEPHKPSPKQAGRLESIFRDIKHTYQESEQEDIIKGIEKGILESRADLPGMMPY